MKKLFKFDLRGHFLSNRVKYLIILASLFVGITLGAVMAKGTYTKAGTSGVFEEFISLYTLRGVTGIEVFKESVISNIRILILLWVSGFFVWLSPINLITLASKGFGIGYVISYFLSDGGIIGFLVAFTSLLFQNLLILPAIIVYSQIQLDFSIQYRKAKSSPARFRQSRRLLERNLLTLILMIAISLISSAFEGYIGNLCIKFIMQF